MLVGQDIHSGQSTWITFSFPIKISDLEQREKSSQDDYVKEEVLVKNLEQEVR